MVGSISRAGGTPIKTITTNFLTIQFDSIIIQISSNTHQTLNRPPNSTTTLPIDHHSTLQHLFRPHSRPDPSSSSLSVNPQRSSSVWSERSKDCSPHAHHQLIQTQSQRSVYSLLPKVSRPLVSREPRGVDFQSSSYPSIYLPSPPPPPTPLRLSSSIAISILTIITLQIIIQVLGSLAVILIPSPSDSSDPTNSFEPTSSPTMVYPLNILGYSSIDHSIRIIPRPINTLNSHPTGVYPQLDGHQPKERKEKNSLGIHYLPSITPSFFLQARRPAG